MLQYLEVISIQTNKKFNKTKLIPHYNKQRKYKETKKQKTMYIRLHFIIGLLHYWHM